MSVATGRSKENTLRSCCALALPDAHGPTTRGTGRTIYSRRITSCNNPSKNPIENAVDLQTDTLACMYRNLIDVCASKKKGLQATRTKLNIGKLRAVTLPHPLSDDKI